MKDTKRDNKIIITIILKNIIYLCWYSYAIIMSLFIKDGMTDNDIFYLIVSFLIIYFIRETAKHFYKKITLKAYHTYKHNIEMHYYKKLKSLSMNKIDEIDKEYLSDKMLEVSYNSTKCVCTTGEYIIPAIIGTIILIGKLVTINLIVAVVVSLLLVIILFLRHRYLLKQEVPKHNNYNDLLRDLVHNIKTIKKLNVFDFTVEKLDNCKDNDICIIKHTDEVSDIRLNNGIFIILSIILISIFFLLSGTVNRLGVMIFFIVVMLKLQDLLYQISPTIINFHETKKNKSILDSHFNEPEELKYENKFKKISVKDGVVNYKSGVSIKIPNFDLNKGDQISILGKSGQGKSTILNVLSGASKLDEGKILFDNKEKDAVINAIHVTKETTILKISLRDNICLGEKVSDEELLKYIKEIGLNSWFNTLLYGLDTILDEREVKMTESQKQRINILRTIVSSKEIIFLDEPSHDLDIETEKLVATMITKYLKKKTIIIVTHRPTLTTICKKHFFIQNHILLETEPLL